MSLENLKGFFEKVESDKELQGKLVKIRKESEKEATAQVVKVASAAGFEFTAAELAQARKEQWEQLSPEELMGVAGGRLKRAIKKMAGDCCYYAQGCMPGFSGG